MPLLEVENIVKTFRRGRGPVVRAVNDVSFAVDEGHTTALIGESGSGKSTVARVVLGLTRPDSGHVRIDGTDLTQIPEKQLRAMRSSVTAVFQEPYESLNPRMTVEAIVGEPLRIFDRSASKATRRDRVVQSMEEVGLSAAHLRRHPGDLSGGQQQRIGIARALIVRPRLIVLDEPTSSLDLTVRATILMLLDELQRRHNLAYLFISHDIATVRYFSTTTAVMYLGHFMETGPTADVIDHPAHPYTVAMLSSTLSVDEVTTAAPKRLQGESPSPATRFTGCPLASRCPHRIDRCDQAPVPLSPITSTRSSACVRTTELVPGLSSQEVSP
ncbi:oligopeptide/dipeptide ABC transporter ATP-binding protein [Amycolatopsis jejuensis]|uniref:oligopeptide/dipeptide ABC transporter ATP-binding protein n=1 Tax=Amycolatopsis jejuensis TaxID=330084 RepID=UPI00068E58AA|nr:ABC transporter ATP-binding protein [Amycolatopsis jejuensis]